jgi:hypothetical protein
LPLAMMRDGSFRTTLVTRRVVMILAISDLLT